MTRAKHVLDILDSLPDVKSAHLSLRKIEPFGNKYLFKLIKMVAGVGYDEPMKDSKFKMVHNDVMKFVASNSNLQRIVKERGIETDYSVLSDWNKEGSY